MGLNIAQGRSMLSQGPEHKPCVPGLKVEIVARDTLNLMNPEVSPSLESTLFVCLYGTRLE